MLYNYIELLLSCTCVRTNVLDSDETRLSTASVRQQLVEGNEVVRKEMIIQLSTEPTATCRTGSTMRIQRNVTERKKETRKSGGQKNSILSWRAPSLHNWKGNKRKIAMQLASLEDCFWVPTEIQT